MHVFFSLFKHHHRDFLLQWFCYSVWNCLVSKKKKISIKLYLFSEFKQQSSLYRDGILHVCDFSRLNYYCQIIHFSKYMSKSSSIWRQKTTILYDQIFYFKFFHRTIISWVAEYKKICKYKLLNSIYFTLLLLLDFYYKRPMTILVWVLTKLNYF